MLMVANYGGGSVSVLPIGEDGKLGAVSHLAQHSGSSVNPRRQEAPHAHGVHLDPAGKLLAVPDLGLDKVMLYRLDAEAGTLKPCDPPAAEVAPGSGPRHLAFHPNGQHAYVINEMSNTVTAFDHDAESGKLTPTQVISTLPESFQGVTYTAEIFVHPSGKFLYGSNRGHDSLAIFAIDEASGRLTSIGQTSTGGKSPRSFAIDPTGRFLLAANQGSD